jgi:hypothetical protein
MVAIPVIITGFCRVRGLRSCKEGAASPYPFIGGSLPQIGSKTVDAIFSVYEPSTPQPAVGSQRQKCMIFGAGGR